MLNRELTNRLIKEATARPTSASKEAKQAAAFDLARRQAAKTILNPNEVSGEYDAGRALQTSLRGHLRPMTMDDLRAFQENVKNLKKKFIGGIKAQSVIDLALKADTDRANKEIRMAIPAHFKGGSFHFITNAGPDSDKSRHHVKVEFLDFEAAVGASPNDPKKIGKAVANGRLKFDCDCGRHTFWFRYIATIGKFNVGRAETGFPKIRNPNLQGVACKHALRTMHVILKDQAVHLKIAGQVLKAREVLDGSKLKAERVKAADLRKHAEEQQAASKYRTTLKTSAQKAVVAAARKAKRDMKQAAIEKAKPASPSAAKSKQSAEARKIAQSAKVLLTLGAITQAQYNEITKTQ